MLNEDLCFRIYSTLVKSQRRAVFLGGKVAAPEVGLSQTVRKLKRTPPPAKIKYLMDGLIMPWKKAFRGSAKFFPIRKLGHLLNPFYQVTSSKWDLHKPDNLLSQMNILEPLPGNKVNFLLHKPDFKLDE